MESSAWSLSPMCQNAQHTSYDFQSNGQCICNHQHNHIHQHPRVHNSPTTIAKARWRMEMESSAWSQSSGYQNAQLTPYDCQSRHGIISMTSHQYAQIHSSHAIISRARWRAEIDGIMSMITVTNMPECATHNLWLPEQGTRWIWNHQHDYSHWTTHPL